MRNNFAMAASPDDFINARLRGGFNEAVFNAQIWMTLAGHDPGPIDGLYGPQTAGGINQYLNSLGDGPDGTISLEQYQDLAASALTAIQGRVEAVAGQGDAAVVGTDSAFSDYTRDAQIMIRALDIDPGPIDGLYGPKTQAGIEAYQRANDMDVTGVLTAEQYAELYEHYSRTVGAHLEAAAAHDATSSQSHAAPVIETGGGAPAVNVPAGGYARVVAYGDSIANGVGLYAGDAQTAGLPVVNLGDDGAGLINDPAGLRQSVSQIQPGDLVVVSLGTNDFPSIHNGTYTMDQYKEMLGERLDAIIAEGGQPVLLGMSTDRTNFWQGLEGEFNDALREVAEARGIPFSDREDRIAHAVDGIHYDPDGYRQILDNVFSDAGIDLNTPQPDAAPALSR